MMSRLRCGSHAVDAYSRMGRTIVVYVEALAVELQRLKFLFRKPTVLFAFAVDASMC